MCIRDRLYVMCLATILAPLVGHSDHHIHNSEEFASRVREVKLNTYEIMLSYDVTSFFTSIPTPDAITIVKRRLEEDNTLSTRSSLNPDQICLLLDLYLSTTYFTYRGDFYRQKHGCAMGSLVWPIVANLYMEEVEKKALNIFQGMTSTHWFRYVDNT